MTAVSGSHSRTVSRVLQLSNRSSDAQSRFYQRFLDAGHEVPADLSGEWSELCELCRSNNRGLADSARFVPVAKVAEEFTPEAEAVAGIDQSLASYVGEQLEKGGVEAVWASAIMGAGQERPNWVDRDVANCVRKLLRPDIVVSSDLMEELVVKIMAVLSREFDDLSKLLRTIDRLDHDLESAFSGGIRITDQAMKRFGDQAAEIDGGDMHLLEVAEEIIIERYEDLIHPDARIEAAVMLRERLWVGAPQVDVENERPVAALFDVCANIVSAKAGEVLSTARGFGIRPI